VKTQCQAFAFTNWGQLVPLYAWDICDRILKLLKDHLEETSAAGESKVFYKKMKVGTFTRSCAFKAPLMTAGTVTCCSAAG
jgi:hypothetical protein